MATIHDILDVILSQMDALGRPISSRLQSGLDINRIVELTKAAGLAVPRSVCDLYSWRNGTKPHPGDSLDDLSFLPGYYFMPLEEAIASHQAGNEALDTVKKDSLPDDPEPDFWRVEWLPLFGNNCGEYYIIECKKNKADDGPIQKVQQGFEPAICYKGLLAMLRTIEACYQTGAFFVDESGCLDIDEKKHAVIARKHNPRVKCWATAKAAAVRTEKPLSDKKLLKKVLSATHEVRQGNVDTGYSELKTLVTDSTYAAVSLAGIEAFRWNWVDAIHYASQVLKRVEAVYSMNVIDEMIGLVYRAGRESAAWDLLAATARDALAENDKRIVDEYHESTRQRLSNHFKEMLNWAISSGNSNPIGNLHWKVSMAMSRPTMESLSSEQKTALYCDAVAKLKPRDRDAQTLFSLARNCEQHSDAIRIYEENESQFGFDQGVYVAKLYVQSNHIDKAWGIVEKKVSTWWPVELTQVAPVILLLDEDLQKIATKERCAWILTTPRGPEGEKKK